MGMKKSKVALQFIIEIFIVTIIAVIIGASVGTISSVPVANKLLENQISSQNETQMNIEQNFGRPGNPDDMDIQMPPDKQLGFFDNLPKKEDFNYISEIDSATNITVVLYMLLIAIGLTLVAGAASLLFIMRYIHPSKYCQTEIRRIFMAILKLNDVSFSYGSTPVLKNISLEFEVVYQL